MKKDADREYIPIQCFQASFGISSRMAGMAWMRMSKTVLKTARPERMMAAARWQSFYQSHPGASGATLAEARQLARHGDMRMTMRRASNSITVTGRFDLSAYGCSLV